MQRVHLDTLSHWGNWEQGDDSAAERNIKPPFMTCSLFSVCYFTIMRCKNLWHLPFRHHRLETVTCQEQAHASIRALKRAEESRRATAYSTPCRLCRSYLHYSLMPAHGLVDVSGFCFCISNTNISLFSVEPMTTTFKAGPCSQAVSVWWQY